MRSIIATTIVAALAVAACKSDSKKPADKQQPAPATQAPAAPAKPAKATPPWGDPKSLVDLSKLNGAWVVKDFGMVGMVEAWNIDGPKVTVYKPKDKTEAVKTLKLETPCDARLSNGSGGTLVIDGDDVYLGLGDGGWKKDGTVIACMGFGVYYYKDGTCTFWKLRFGDVESKPATCSEADGRFSGKTEDSNGDELSFVNDHVLLSEQLADNKLARAKDWDAAKAQADELYAKKTKK